MVPEVSHYVKYEGIRKCLLRVKEWKKISRTIEHDRGCFTLIFPMFTIGVEDTMAEKVGSCMAELGSFDIVFKVVYVG